MQEDSRPQPLSPDTHMAHSYPEWEVFLPTRPADAKLLQHGVARSEDGITMNITLTANNFMNLSIATVASRHKLPATHFAPVRAPRTAVGSTMEPFCR